jgi:hypothetical protein
VTVRIKLRDNGEFTRVRVSHPRGTGNFYAPRVRKVSGWAFYGGAGAIGRWPLSDAPSQRIKSARGGGKVPLLSVSVTFSLRNGKHIAMSCAKP